MPLTPFPAEAVTQVAVAAVSDFWWRNSNGANPSKQPKVTPARKEKQSANALLQFKSNQENQIPSVCL